MSCPPDSPLARDPPAIAQEPTPPSEKTFIYDIKAATNTCQNPQHLLLHGQFLRENSPPTPHRPLVPFFAHCKTTLHSDILVTPLYLTDRSVPDDWSWANKNNDKLMWRGTATGAWHSPKTNWRNAHRARLLNTTGTKNAQAGEGSLPDELELLYPTLSEDLSVGSPKKVSRKAINNDRMDIAFVGPTAGCHPETCEIMNKAFRYTEHVDHQVAKSYKYIFDVSPLVVLFSTSPLPSCFFADRWSWLVGTFSPSHVHEFRYLQGYDLSRMVHRSHRTMAALHSRTNRLLRLVRHVHVLWRQSQGPQGTGRLGGEDWSGRERLDRDVLEVGRYDSLHVQVS